MNKPPVHYYPISEFLSLFRQCFSEQMHKDLDRDYSKIQFYSATEMKKYMMLMFDRQSAYALKEILERSVTK